MLKILWTQCIWNYSWSNNSRRDSRQKDGVARDDDVKELLMPHIRGIDYTLASLAVVDALMWITFLRASISCHHGAG